MSNEKQSLGLKSSTVTAFLNDKHTPDQCKELQKLRTLIQSYIEKYSFIEARSKISPKISKISPKISKTSPKN